MPVIVIPLAVVFSIFMSVVFVSNTEQVPPSPKTEDLSIAQNVGNLLAPVLVGSASSYPDMKEFLPLQEIKTECGTVKEFTDGKMSRKILFVEFLSEKGEPFLLMRLAPDVDSFGAWFDSDGDSKFDSYLEGTEGHKKLREKYSKPCDILDKK